MAELHVSGTGNAVGDAELKSIGPNNTPLCTFTLAFNRRYKYDDQWKDETCFVGVQTFIRAESVSKQIKKGQPVSVFGHLRQNVWQGKGGRMEKFDIVATEVYPNIKLENTKQESKKENAQSPIVEVIDEVVDELPF